ncbi:MAG TPA: lysophospholipid acyltransferase family protein [Planctomycetaceae bacterium]|mgnify:FL=1|nr:lysophospholipid acyltransferase family protein [Planctomycetaceae bacterium]HQZ64264.1 lysophospholipid acyltransferase family protein [Planctomycetaceae bacterium]
MTVLKARQLLEYGFFQTLLFVVKCLPVRATITIASGLAWVMMHLVPKKLSRHDVAKENLRVAFGETLSDEEADRIIYGMWRHLFRMVCEMVQLPRRFRLTNCGSILDFDRRIDCVKTVCSGRPVLFLGGHFGNWEISVNTFGHFGFPMGVVARQLDNPWLQSWFKAFRESTGNWLILKQGAGAELSAIMESCGMASLLCDQDAGRTGVFVDFFGRPASTFKSIALLALQYNALVVVGGAYRLPDAAQNDSHWVRFNLATQDVIDPADFQGANGINELTQRFTSSLEALIRKAPEQYFWVHRRWRTPPDARRRRREGAAA